ncbi:arsenate reductase/protein-tyrosine-phosphatase family protein [Candidatus Berkiella aquae]|uniref:Low molecular weight phosphotyrosine protein phosphatase n=1 Tax=Candidatus Berkiella aquae TaxID=295108 RepID=A0A0Q9YN42_9GAMM|nr:low molecular weight protein tyrosine phosphatase family protein [Candidatus Berkiella aquae]MCS5711636.1 low molecular weight protein tyrosine phosphatase family protein [Candidatus Berkiella aquae]
MKKILFICSHNKLRSPTAEALFSDYPNLEVRSAGLKNDADISLGQEDVMWADTIFVMEKAHLTKLKTKFRSLLKNQKVICLDIPDKYAYMDEALIKILKNKVPPYLK